MPSEPRPEGPSLAVRLAAWALFAGWALLPGAGVGPLVDRHWLDFLNEERRVSAIWWRDYGATALQRGRAKEALSAFEHAVSIRPSDADATADLGAALLVVGRADEAGLALKRALSLGTTQPNVVHERLAELSAERGDLDAALEHHQAAAKTAPDPSDSLLSVGMLLHDRGRNLDAIETLQSALAGALDVRQSYRAAMLRGRAVHRDEEDVVRSIDAALARPITDEDLARYDLETLSAGRKRSPKIAKLRFSLGTALAAEGRWGEAETELRAANELAPGNPFVQRALAKVEAQQQGR